ncbi:MAG: winged helix-turn-helix transcriptional regulator [Burkholderiales bacterium]|nr:winged helix-turn-helix transcriptional regulator [Burkholderiales bacterium]
MSVLSGQVFYNLGLWFVVPDVRHESQPFFAIGVASMPKAGTAPEDVFELIGRAGEIEQASRAMKAIAHPLRLKVLCLLGSGEIAVQEIVEAVGTSQSNVSQHLAILRDKKVLTARKDANRVYYSIADGRTLQLVAMMREVFCGDLDNAGKSTGR